MTGIKIKNKKREYFINDILRGYNDFEKLKKIYSDLKKDVIKKNPIQIGTEPTITIERPNWRGRSYLWEMYSLENNELIMIEAFGGTDSYSSSFMFPKSIEKIEQGIDFLKLTVHNPQDNTISKIEKIISKYPKSLN